LALAYTRRGNNHCGIFYETFKGELKLLHLAFHLLLYSDDVFGELGWISPPIEPETRDAISKICRRFYSKNYDQKVPYGFSHRARVSSGGDVVRAKPGDGFTCTTLIMRILEPAFVQLLDETDWPVDARWAQQVIADIEAYGRAKEIDVSEHVAAMRRDSTTWARFKPEELCAACCHETVPVPYSGIVTLAPGLSQCVRENVNVLPERS
jgi:hypothetical protein